MANYQGNPMAGNNMAGPALQAPAPQALAPQAPDSKERNRQMVMHRTRLEAARIRGDLMVKAQDGSTIVAQPLGQFNPMHTVRSPYAGRQYMDDIHQQIAQQQYGPDGNRMAKGYGITLKRILAAGGFGIAALVEHRGNRNVRTDCVMKIEKTRPFASYDSIKLEQKALNAKINDKRDAENEGKRPYMPRSSTEARDKNWDIKIQRERSFILMEYANGKSLHTWLNKSSRSGRPWPNKALWLLFKCLIKGLIGIGYPPKENYQRDHPDWDPNNPIEEYIPGTKKPQQTVHFDLDPKNILVSLEPHGPMPLFKISDFGCAKFFDEANQKPDEFTEEIFWRSRSLGKPGYHTPEQFHRSWDSLRPFNDGGSNMFLEANKPSIAGNYGMPCNIYQVGVIMWCAITGAKFQDPVVGWKFGGESGLESDDHVVRWANQFFSSPRVPGDGPPPQPQPPHTKNGEEYDTDDEEEEPVRTGDKRKRTGKDGNPQQRGTVLRLKTVHNPAPGTIQQGGQQQQQQQMTLNQIQTGTVYPMPQRQEGFDFVRDRQRPPPQQMIIDAFRDVELYDATPIEKKDPPQTFRRMRYPRSCGQGPVPTPSVLQQQVPLQQPGGQQPGGQGHQRGPSLNPAAATFQPNGQFANPPNGLPVQGQPQQQWQTPNPNPPPVFIPPPGLPLPIPGLPVPPPGLPLPPQWQPYVNPFPAPMPQQQPQRPWQPMNPNHNFNQSNHQFQPQQPQPPHWRPNNSNTDAFAPLPHQQQQPGRYLTPFPPVQAPPQHWMPGQRKGLVPPIPKTDNEPGQQQQPPQDEKSYRQKLIEQHSYDPYPDVASDDLEMHLGPFEDLVVPFSGGGQSK
ncbi:hypothetical protein GCG54_00000092 [Colletotrichum gloeosporioides]|uniref:Protein kinase domain-containing protein n=1 Tax=Colletotrichum gloeosporioides TaxID=474922 RepID=A0A8H4CMP8_COLGL|nr:uncharacterized protein GCG54_00000092 [Colletotrichum gloeosporioides]KAF3806726.1 hypothetical protein GCG54_00000092 [Colletotrichum gloeosporioides]